MIILGIDPGYERLGIAIIKKEEKNKEILLYSTCFKTLAKEEHPERLKQLGLEIDRVIKEYQPSILAIETLFFENNAKTAMKVSESRGAIIYVGKTHGLKIVEFTPMEIKVAVTGHGRSDKKQVISMVERLVKIDKEIKYDDEYDAIAVALTGLVIKK